MEIVTYFWPSKAFQLDIAGLGRLLILYGGSISYRTYVGLRTNSPWKYLVL